MTKNKTLFENKTLRIVLNCIMYTTIFMALIILLIHLLASTWDALIGQWTYFYLIVDGKISMNWACSMIYLSLTLLALISLIMHLIIYIVPDFKKGELNIGIKLMCRILIGLGLVISILALFLPNGVVYMDMVKSPLATPFHAATVLSWIGTPLAFASSIANLSFTFKKPKKIIKKC